MVKRISNDGATDVEPKTNPMAALEALEAEAAGVEQQGEAAAEARAEKEAKTEVDTIAADLADTLAMMATVAGPGMWWLTPEQFEKLWGKPVQKAIAESGAEIMRRHGLSMGGLMSQYGPYIALAGALGPSALATVNAYKQAKRVNAQAIGGSDGDTAEKG